MFVAEYRFRSPIPAAWCYADWIVCAAVTTRALVPSAMIDACHGRGDSGGGLLQGWAVKEKTGGGGLEGGYSGIDTPPRAGFAIGIEHSSRATDRRALGHTSDDGLMCPACLTRPACVHPRGANGWVVYTWEQALEREVPS